LQRRILNTKFIATFAMNMSKLNFQRLTARPGVSCWKQFQKLIN